MKAAVYRSYGPPEVIQLTDMDIPVLKSNEILVKVYAATLNRTDCGFRSAEYVVSRLFSGLLRPNFPVLGNEFAGQVTGIGSDVTEFKVGDRVFGYDDHAFGAHAEYKTIKEKGAVSLIPSNLTYEQAAPLTEGAHYALSNIRAAKVQPGHHVLVYGATGAIGSAAVQLLNYFGAHVTAVCATPHTELVKSLGAGEVIDYLNQDFTALPRKFDFIFDAVGKSSFGECSPLLKPNGIYISTELGKNGENIYLAILHKFSKGKRVLFPIPGSSKSDIVFLGELAGKGIFRPLTDRTYPLSQIVDAYRYVETGQKRGNVILLPGS